MNSEWENPSIIYKLINSIGNNRLFSFIYKNYIKTLNLKGSENILDFGSGSGASARHLAKLLTSNNGHLTCIDTSKYWTNVAKKRMKNYNNITFLIGEIQKLHLEPNSLDVIIIHYTLHDVAEQFRNEVIKKLSQLLKPEGSLFIKEPQREDDGMPVNEILTLMKTNNLTIKSSNEKNNVFSGEFTKHY